MRQLYLIISGIVFLVVGAIHLLRIIYQTPVMVSTTQIPMVISYFGFPGALVLCIWAFWSLKASGNR